MTNNQLTDERIKELMHIGRYSYHVVCGREIADICTALEELQERRKAEQDSEPVAWTDEEELRDANESGSGYLFGIERDANKFADPRRQIMLYRHAQQPVVPPMQHWEELCREHPDMSIGDAIIRAAWWNHCRAAMLQAGNSPVIPEGWQVEAEKLAEIYGMSFVLFRHGEAPQCADPTKVVISFTDKGLGHDTLPAAPQEVNNG